MHRRFGSLSHKKHAREAWRVALLLHLVGGWLLAGMVDRSAARYRMGEERLAPIELMVQFDQDASPDPEMPDQEMSVSSTPLLVTIAQAQMGEQTLVDTASSEVSVLELLPSETLRRMHVELDVSAVAARIDVEPESTPETIERKPIRRSRPKNTPAMPRSELAESPRLPRAQIRREAPASVARAASLPSAAPPTSSSSATLIAPDFSNNAPPRYPRRLANRGLRGEVLLQLTVDETGQVTHVKLLRSSGVPLLDAAAVNAVRHWKGKPAMRDGAPVASTWNFPIRFAP